ncbi:PAAR domain-containing protein [Streptomyces sp. CRN 30]|uniref:PAAR domain-containing protein n=1 Tax=Streptomyces sp. CRN 30 TaxID=3075613 RepID=UPI002A8236CF|nr:PAAR domain-containing protein [Streptomyces sp. CRN 30]
MPAAARTGDPTDHGGAVATPPPAAARAVARVLIGGRPAAVVGSLITCPMPPHAALALANVVLPNPAGAAGGTVLIGGLPAARARDRTTCGAMILTGAPNVLIGGL